MLFQLAGHPRDHSCLPQIHNLQSNIFHLNMTIVAILQRRVQPHGKGTRLHTYGVYRDLWMGMESLLRLTFQYDLQTSRVCKAEYAEPEMVL